MEELIKEAAKRMDMGPLALCVLISTCIMFVVLFTSFSALVDGPLVAIQFYILYLSIQIGKQ